MFLTFALVAELKQKPNNEFEMCWIVSDKEMLYLYIPYQNQLSRFTFKSSFVTDVSQIKYI